ncbi:MULTISPECIES: HEAT repeat domain-containing protein [unclassified Streptomyces]|uniref:HEAT repeat domain-containing protein n=1 Tax=unclassified Streptomyces TaxID=2593676 RepID=UPI0004C081BA
MRRPRPTSHTAGPHFPIRNPRHGCCPALCHTRDPALLDDRGVLVRGAAYEALGTAGCPAALAATDPDVAVPALAKALSDANADVREAAVLALTRHRAAEDARAVLAAAATDSDADVRACAAQALRPRPTVTPVLP